MTRLLHAEPISWSEASRQETDAKPPPYEVQRRHPAAALPESRRPVARLRRRGGRRAAGRLVRPVPSGDPGFGGRTPPWVRAEQPPEVDTLDGSLVLMPNVSLSKIPKEWWDGPIVRRRGHRGPLGPRHDDRGHPRSGSIPIPVPPRWTPTTPIPIWSPIFLAVGFCHLQVELTTRQLRYMSSLDAERFRREAVRAAEAIMHGDEETARESIQRAFDTLTEAREYFYPVEAKLLDLTLVAPTTLGEPLRRELAGPAADEPADFGRHGGRDGPTRAGNARRAASRAGRRHGVDRRRRVRRRGPAAVGAGVDPRRPAARIGLVRGASWAIGRRSSGGGDSGCRRCCRASSRSWAFSGACHFTLDAGRFPTGNQSKVRWEGLDAASLESLARVPLDASRHDTFLKLPERLGRVMDLDHTATAVFAHWPGKSSRWYGDLRRTARYSPVLGRFVTIDKYFEDTSGSGQVARHGPDDYRSPYLVEAVEAAQRDPISRWVRYHRRRVHLDVSRLARLSGDDARRPGRVAAGRPGNGAPGGTTPDRTGGIDTGRDRSRRADRRGHRPGRCGESPARCRAKPSRRNPGTCWSIR